MTITYRRIATASLEAPVQDPSDRNILPMSTLVTVDHEHPNHLWLAEAAWDGLGIGDIQVWKNANANAGTGQPKFGDNGDPLEPEWVWWAGIPRGRVKSYKFGGEHAELKPQTEKPFAERQEKPGKAGPARASGGAAA